MSASQLDKNAGADMSMMAFVQPGCPSRFAYQNEHRVKGLNAETLARVFLPTPSWLSTPDFESEDDNITEYTIPALIVRDHSYQPVIPRTLGSADAFPAIQPIVSFTGPVIGSGRDLLHGNSAAALDDTQLSCCGFKMTERRDSQFQPNALLTCTGKIAGLLDHQIMTHAPAFEQDYIFIVVPDTWTFLDRAMSNQASATQLLPTTPKGSVGNPRTIAMRWPEISTIVAACDSRGPAKSDTSSLLSHEDPGDSETDTEPVNHPATSASGPIRPPASISSRPHRARHPPKNIL
ncbi:hypothetical protein HRG_013199 [Hirsutella rhossiliensis]